MSVCNDECVSLGGNRGSDATYMRILWGDHAHVVESIDGDDVAWAVPLQRGQNGGLRAGRRVVLLVRVNVGS